MGLFYLYLNFKLSLSCTNKGTMYITFLLIFSHLFISES